MTDLDLGAVYAFRPPQRAEQFVGPTELRRLQAIFDAKEPVGDWWLNRVEWHVLPFGTMLGTAHWQKIVHKNQPQDNTMPDWQKRLREEHDALEDKVLKLVSYLAGDRCGTENDAKSMHLLEVQLILMRAYRDVLNARIARLSEDFK